MARSNKDFSGWIKTLYSIYRNTYILSSHIKANASEGNAYSVDELIKYIKGVEIKNPQKYESLIQYIQSNGTNNLFVINAFSSPQKIVYTPQRREDLSQNNKYDGNDAANTIRRTTMLNRGPLNELDLVAHSRLAQKSAERKYKEMQDKHQYNYEVPVFKEDNYLRHIIVILNEDNYQPSDLALSPMLKTLGKAGYIRYLQNQYNEKFGQF